MTKLRNIVSLAAVFCGLSAGAHAQIFIGGTQYGATGQTEALTAVFTQPDGGVTTGLYDNFVEITVSGTGLSDGAALNDAFYLLGPPPTHDSSYYQLTFGTTTLGAYDYAQDITNSIVYDLIAGKAVSAPYVPAYESDNTYSFIINTGVFTDSALHFGVSDGVFSDNAGAYSLEITQLTAIAEPASILALAAGLGSLGVLRRRSRA